MRIAFQAVALVGLAQASSLASQAESKTDATYYCPENIFPPGATSPPKDDNVFFQA